MPNMKYFQGIADIERHLLDVLREFNNEKYGAMTLESWNVGLNEKEAIQEEAEVLRYLLDCQYGFSRKDASQKPSLEVVNRCFNRHLSYLEDVHNCHQGNINKTSSKLIVRQYRTCRHYLFQFTKPAWVDKLPNEIETLESRMERMDGKL